MGKFAKYANAKALELSHLFNRSIRLSLRAGIAAAINNTNQDSSNAAYHWLVAEASKSRPGQRREGTLRDLRQTKGVRGEARAKTGPIGFRGDRGSNAYATLNYVRSRETAQVIDKYVVGRTPSGKFYFYNPLLEGKSSPDYAGQDIQDYQFNADIEFAGEQAVSATIEAADRYLRAGLARGMK